MLELQEERDEETTEAMQRSLRAQQAEEEIAIARHEMKKRQRDQEGDLFFWIMAFYWLMNRTIIATRKKLSPANDFALVCNISETRKSYAG